MNTEKIMEDIQSVQDNIREIKSTWGNTIMTLDNIKSGLKADVQKKVDEAYQQGLNDAWEATKRIFGYEIDGGIPINKVREVFGIAENAIFCTADIIRNYTAQQAIDKIKAYEDKHSDRIEVGDVVERYVDGKLDSKGIYLQEDSGYWRCLFDTNGVLMTFAYPKGQFKKTGKHYDIASILEAMRT